MKKILICLTTIAVHTQLAAFERIEENLATVKKNYITAVSHLSQTISPQGIYIQEICIGDSGPIAVGYFNTESPSLIEEDGLKPQLEKLDFQNASAFAAKFNETFTHRQEWKARLLEANAKEVDDSFNADKDITIGDKAFVNVRKAVLIWMVYHIIPRTKQFSYCNIEFDFDEIKAFIKNQQSLDGVSQDNQGNPVLSLTQAIFTTKSEAQAFASLMKIESKKVSKLFGQLSNFNSSELIEPVQLTDTSLAEMRREYLYWNNNLAVSLSKLQRPGPLGDMIIEGQLWSINSNLVNLLVKQYRVNIENSEETSKIYEGSDLFCSEELVQESIQNPCSDGP